MKLLIVIVNWNSGDYLRQCVASISDARLPDGWHASVVVVDNNSQDGSADNLPPQMAVIRNAENLGFGAACNQGTRQELSDAVLFLNPDARLFRGSLAAPLHTLDTNPQIGIVGVKLLDEQGNVARGCARFPTPLNYVAKALALDRLNPRLGHFMIEWDHESTRLVDHVMGAFFMVRRSVFDTLGGFDERFFVYLEDLDFSLRAKRLGWDTLYFADVQAFHAGGGTSKHILGRRLFYSLRSRLQYSRKHFSPAGLAAVLMSTFIIEPISRAVLLLAQGRISDLAHLCEGYALLFKRAH